MERVVEHSCQKLSSTVESVVNQRVLQCLNTWREGVAEERKKGVDGGQVKIG